MAFFSRKLHQFTYFSLQLRERDWSNKVVLDFGGNIGNLLRDPRSTLREKNYTCIDVCAEAVAAGSRAFPTAHWHHYNRHCFFFNPHGVPSLPLPDLQQCYDYIVAYSVFTNTPRSDMFELVAALTRLLKPNGKLAFTFIDPHYHSWPEKYPGNNLRWRLQRDSPDIDCDALLQQAKQANWCILINGRDLYTDSEKTNAYRPEQQKTHHVFYTATYMQRLYPQASILAPVNDEMQHCCILTRLD